jgi:hypothetical protein
MAHLPAAVLASLLLLAFSGALAGTPIQTFLFPDTLSDRVKNCLAALPPERVDELVAPAGDGGRDNPQTTIAASSTIAAMICLADTRIHSQEFLKTCQRVLWQRRFHWEAAIWRVWDVLGIYSVGVLQCG